MANSKLVHKARNSQNGLRHLFTDTLKLVMHLDFPNHLFKWSLTFREAMDIS
jgi:hypothetical protein